MKVAELQIRQGIRPVAPAQGGQTQRAKKSTLEHVDFGSLLQKQMPPLQELKFSAHALKRLESRSLSLSEDDLLRLQQGVQQLKEKGARQSVVLLDQRAFVVSVENQTVVTAIDSQQSQGRVFTNIDSLAIV